MRVSQRLDYALRALVVLAGQPQDRPLPAGEVAETLGMPRRFVEQQVTILAQAGLVTCRRGASGGCMLARPAERITVADVATALHGEVLDIPHQQNSATAEMWELAAGGLAGILGGFTLEGLAQRQEEIDAESRPMYYI